MEKNYTKDEMNEKNNRVKMRKKTAQLFDIRRYWE